VFIPSEIMGYRRVVAGKPQPLPGSRLRGQSMKKALSKL
jgi:hypothetical protein